MEEKTFWLMKIRNDSSFKGAYGLTMSHILHFNQKSSRNSHIKVCKDTVMITQLVIYASKDFFLTEAINDRIEMFKSSGLIEYWQHLDLEKNIIRDENKDRPKQLTLDQLMGCFEIWMVGCVGSFVVFCFELVSDKYNKIISKLTG